MKNLYCGYVVLPYAPWYEAIARATKAAKEAYLFNPNSYTFEAYNSCLSALFMTGGGDGGRAHLAPHSGSEVSP